MANREVSRPAPCVRNISFLTTYFSSSVHPSWHKKSVGEPNDHFAGTDRYSFHTDVEEDPFVHFGLPGVVAVEHLTVRLRDTYGQKSLPLEVLFRKGDDPWSTAAVLTDDKPSQTVPVGRVCDAIRLQHKGVGMLALPGVDIFVGEDAFRRLTRSLEDTLESVVIHCPFYGIGGQLAVCASGLEAARRTGKSSVFANGPITDVLSYPPKIELTPSMTAMLRDNLAPSISEHIIAKKVPPPGVRKGGRWVENDLAMRQKRSIVVVSRDNIPFSQLAGEDMVETQRRLYGRMVPSDLVLAKLGEIEMKFSIDDDVYAKSIGLHLRHGNGERYLDGSKTLWGVKPPTLRGVVDSLKDAARGRDVDTVLLASDFPGAAEVLASELPSLNFIAISDLIQEAGAGCSHNQKYFDPSSCRQDVDEKESNIQAMAEILLLGRCRILCGGKSYFTKAVIGFGGFEASDVFDLPNFDRYIELDEDVLPVLEAKSAASQNISRTLKERRLHRDGLFLRGPRTGEPEDHFELSFFDVTLSVGSSEKICAYVAEDSFRERLKELRWYA